jgi:hypothetical protein
MTYQLIPLSVVIWTWGCPAAGQAEGERRTRKRGGGEGRRERMGE